MSLAEEKVDQGLCADEIGLQGFGNGLGVTAPKGIDAVVDHQDVHRQEQGLQGSINGPVPHQPLLGGAVPVPWRRAPADADHRGPSPLQPLAQRRAQGATGSGDGNAP